MLNLIDTTARVRPAVTFSEGLLDGTRHANSLFAIQPAEGERTTGVRPPLPYLVRRTLEPIGEEPIGLEIFAGSAATLATRRDPATGCCAYLWGHAAHPDVKRADLLPWAVRTLAEGNVKAFCNVAGHFLLIVDDRNTGRVHFATDILGMRPWFVSMRDGRFVGGSHVWELHRAGLIQGEIDYEVVGGWVYYLHDLHGRSLFKGCSRLPHSVVSTWEHGRLTSRSYLDWAIGDRIVPREQMADIVHEQVTRGFDALLEGMDEASLALSGGFDSRYLAAMAVRKPELRLSTHVVVNDPTELAIAQRVADALEIKLDVIPTDGTAWNMFDEPYHYMHDGFPITKQVSQLVAERRPGVPMLNGFLGDGVIRGARDRWFDKTDRETTEDLAAVLFRAYDSRANRLDLLHPDIVSRVKQQAMAPLRQWVDRGRALGKPFPYLSYFNRHGLGVANNFLQHLDWCEAIMPLCTPGLVGLRFMYDYSCYGWDFYEYLIASRFPELAGIPHNSRLPQRPGAKPAMSRAIRAWAAELLTVLARPGTLLLVNRRKVIPRLLGVLAGRRDVEPVARFLQRLWLLEKRCRRAGIAFDWNAI